MATDPENQPPASENPQDLERRFWRSLSLRPPLYGADVEGSLFDDDLQVGAQCQQMQVLQEQLSMLKPAAWLVCLRNAEVDQA